MGLDYVQFRVFYALRKKTGILKIQFPVNPTIHSFISLKDWKEQSVQFFFDSKESLTFSKTPTDQLKKRYEDFLEGKIWYFNAIQYDVGRDYDWLTNPSNNFQYDIRKHWSEVEDISTTAGDIKFVWEKSRFSYIFDIIRYDYHFDKDCSELVFSEIESWIAANPINQGPNYKCSQEISLRVLNWIFILYYYKNSKALTEGRFQSIIHYIYWQIKHDYANINFSRKTVRNNHAVTECLMLYLGGLLLPFFPESKEWKSKGKKWFEEEILYQVYEDGTFLQFSHNYHRVLIQLLTYTFYISNANKEQFDKKVYDRAWLSLDYLYQCQAGKNGELPNYGANDGALFFKFNDAEYRDYRPQLDALHYFFYKKPLYTILSEDVNWLSSNLKKQDIDTPSVSIQKNIIREFSQGGIYAINEGKTFTFIKCASYKDRPSHADNLHIDIWVNGENIIRDAGTYKYNTELDLNKYFVGTKGHNTIMLGEENQMKKGPRFIWFNWNTALGVRFESTNDYIYFEGSIKAFEHIAKEITVTRKIKKYVGESIWEIEDSTNYEGGLPLVQLWHFDPKNTEYIDFITSAETITDEQGFYSSEYGMKEKSLIKVFTTHSKKIITNVKVITTP